MKKKYIKPSIEFIKLSPIQHLVASQIQINDNPGTEDIDVEDAREDIFNNTHAIWDNAW